MASTLAPPGQPPGEPAPATDAPSPGRSLATAAGRRLNAPMPQDGLAGWLGPLLVAAVAGVLRFWHLGRPGEKVFDEVYYPSEGASLWDYGVEVKDGVPEYVVHPPLGKWVIGFGEQLFDGAFGWRFATALLGTLAVFVLARAGRRLFRSTLLGCVAGLLLALDGLHLVMSRTGLLDSILMFFVLAAFACLLVDRDATRARLARSLDAAAAGSGPSLGARPWLLAAGALLGAACATKWSGAFYLALFGLMSLLWSASARRAAGVARPYTAALRRDLPVAVVALGVVPVAVYLLSWTGWFLSPGTEAYGRDWGRDNPASGLAGLVPDGLRSLWHYHAQAYEFHRNLRTKHAYQSNPWSWLALGRPVAFWYPQGVTGCGSGSCSQAILALGTPALWWASIAALPVVAFRWLAQRDWRAGAILAGVAAGYLPWFNYEERTIFSFYAVVFVPFLALAVTMVLGMLLGPAPAVTDDGDPEPAGARRRTWGAAVVGAYLLVVVACVAYFWPIYTAQVIDQSDWAARMWFRSWI
ncbi:dolichyl-phosphate-mannose--protein mannosyltransferase [Motilibacter deserti]|uniref:Polyprenol-phosphate-mannose--protein mannosyltransferase n=1 Tax=Motilibacter deserti TaxID=2714956 RepID=A0ABX0H012_9ACTN|nr:phospholipid carrier-dependent glycosyltransferase [Motilibacter deserti]NHC15354.1 phospholipid carrier-dependent glycosyltransferase [Motilibacter deserti]